MPEIVNCPQCERKLRVPDELLGQSVKCPTCGQTFTASVAAPSPAPPPPPPLEPQVLQERYEQSAPPQPSPSAPPPGYLPDSPYANYGNYDSEAERRRHANRGKALAAVSGPATALTVSAILGIIFQGLYIIGQIGQGMGKKGGAQDDAEVIGGLIGGCVGMGIAIALAIVCLIGLQKMKRLESYGWAMASSIIMMLPCFSPCCILGLPFGIWSLVVLNDPQVKEAFRS